MSLKAFHLIFITAASALAFGFGVWELRDYFSPEGRAGNLVMGALAVLIAIALVLYERYFLKKLKKVGYL